MPFFHRRIVRFTSFMLALAMLSAGCVGARKPAQARGPPEAAAPVQPTADEPPLQINPPPPPTPGKTTALEKNEESSSALKRLTRKAVEQEKQLSNYICRIRRREQVNGQDQPEEIILF